MAQSTCTIDDCEMEAISRGWCRRHYNAQYKGVDLPEVTSLGLCPYCGNEFKAGKNRKYCSDSCRHSFKCQQRAKSPCTICGLPTGQLLVVTAIATHNKCRTANRPHGSSAAYTAGCRCTECAAYKAEANRNYAARKRAGLTATKPCEVDKCDGVTAARGLCKTHYRRWARANGLVNSPSEKWGDVRRSNYHARRARMNGASNGDKVMLADLLERDGAICSACHEHIDVHLAWPEPLSPSIDHTLALSKGGEHAMSNTTAMHLVCNMKKGARTMPNPQPMGKTDEAQ